MVSRRLSLSPGGRGLSLFRAAETFEDRDALKLAGTSGTLDPGDGCPTDRPLQWLPDQSGRPASSPYQYAACNQAGALGPIADRPFTLRTYLEEDLGCPLRFGRPPGVLVDRGGGLSRPVLWTTDALRFGLAHLITSSYNSACNQAGALGPIAGRPYNPLKVTDDGAGEDTTTGSIEDYGNIQQLVSGASFCRRRNCP
ncbi:hypothetical protein THAOC_20085 [Thalassiosira oceanica]|uniref:Uncharacterized protein n=1 Tax=Thalassiosira oceanica TaxID=159749 RepID=K0S4A6_THAOC|nr:hypothetical protein THAOC_20085 [Thalassiosira oceanica]|eukprot:EJK59659.1 hypothetical protein THAOC_20085 [Thalassiosira oceanica]